MHFVTYVKLQRKFVVATSCVCVLGINAAECMYIPATFEISPSPLSGDDFGLFSPIRPSDLDLLATHPSRPSRPLSSASPPESAISRRRIRSFTVANRIAFDRSNLARGCDFKVDRVYMNSREFVYSALFLLQFQVTNDWIVVRDCFLSLSLRLP